MLLKALYSLASQVWFHHTTNSTTCSSCCRVMFCSIMNISLIKMSAMLLDWSSSKQRKVLSHSVQMTREQRFKIWLNKNNRSVVTTLISDFFFHQHEQRLVAWRDKQGLMLKCNEWFFYPLGAETEIDMDAAANLRDKSLPICKWLIL